MINVGIIGFGYMGHFHLEKINNMSDMQVIAVYDLKEEKNWEASKLGLKVCDTIDDLVSIPEIDLVVIATMNNSHKSIAIQALNHGKNVLCEKPATMNCEEVLEVIEVAEKQQKFFTVHQNRRWDRDFLAVKEVLRSKVIGDFTTIYSGTLGQRGVCFGWRADPQYGGGMLYDWAPHLIDQALQLYPNLKVKKIYCRKESILTPVVDDFFEIKMFFENEVCVNLCVGTFALQPVPRWYIFGDKGTMILNEFSSDNGSIARIKGEIKGFESVKGKKNLGPSRTMAHLEPENLESIPLVEVEDHSMSYYEDIYCAIKENRSPDVSHADIIRVMKILDKAFESAELGQFVKVE